MSWILNPHRLAVVGGTAPTFVSYTASALNTGTTPKTVSVAVLTGDVIVVAAGAENCGVDLTIGDTVNTYTNQQLIDTGLGSEALATMWTAVAASSVTLTITLTRVGGASEFFGMGVNVFRSATVGTSAKSAAGVAGAPTLNITTTKASSVIVMCDTDWNATTGTATWRTGAGAATSESDFSDGLTYGIHIARHANAGAIGTYAVGLTAPATQKYSLMAVEIKGP